VKTKPMIWAGEETPRVEEQEDYFVVQIHVGQIHAPITWKDLQRELSKL